MKSCKASLPDGKACPNQVNKGQEYCPYHLASQVADEEKILSKILSTLGTFLAAASIFPIGKTVIGKVVKFVGSKKL